MKIEVDASQMARVANLFAAAGQKKQLALVRAVNHTGAKALTQVRRALVKQTGLKRKTIVKAVKATKAFNGSDYVIKTSGGNIRLKHFGARETRRGVSAAPWGKRRVFPGTFIKGGRFPGRRDLAMGKQVFIRDGQARAPISVQRSGLHIADELVTGNAEAMFYRTVETELPKRLSHELYRILGV